MPEDPLSRTMHPLPLLPRRQLHDRAEPPEARPGRPPGEPRPGRVDPGVRDGGGEGDEDGEGQVRARDKGVFGSDRRRNRAAEELHKGGGDDKGERGEY